MSEEQATPSSKNQSRAPSTYSSQSAHRGESSAENVPFNVVLEQPTAAGVSISDTRKPDISLCRKVRVQATLHMNAPSVKNTFGRIYSNGNGFSKVSLDEPATADMSRTETFPGFSHVGVQTSSHENMPAVKPTDRGASSTGNGSSKFVLEQTPAVGVSHKETHLGPRHTFVQTTLHGNTPAVKPRVPEAIPPEEDLSKLKLVPSVVANVHRKGYRRPKHTCRLSTLLPQKNQSVRELPTGMTPKLNQPGLTRNQPKMGLSSPASGDSLHINKQPRLSTIDMKSEVPYRRALCEGKCDNRPRNPRAGKHSKISHRRPLYRGNSVKIGDLPDWPRLIGKSTTDAPPRVLFGTEVDSDGVRPIYIRQSVTVPEPKEGRLQYSLAWLRQFFALIDSVPSEEVHRPVAPPDISQLTLDDPSEEAHGQTASSEVTPLIIHNSTTFRSRPTLLCCAYSPTGVPPALLFPRNLQVGQIPLQMKCVRCQEDIISVPKPVTDKYSLILSQLRTPLGAYFFSWRFHEEADVKHYCPICDVLLANFLHSSSSDGHKQ